MNEDEIKEVLVQLDEVFAEFDFYRVEDDDND